ncbi:MAG: putative transrane anti-sigma factor [Pedosphaera sp.]|nr:putative transrane anti-sigma factor [Pedosphaera sp.]
MQTTNQTPPGSAGDLNHPQREEWMAWLYGEVSRREKTALAAHLSTCSACRAEVQRWQSAMQALDAGKTESFRPPARAPQPLLKWAVAAAFVLAVGFGAGWLASPATADTRALRASLKSELRSELLAELKQQQEAQFVKFVRDTETARALDNKTVLDAVANFNAARKSDYASLREELETVAVHTQNSLQSEQQQIVTLASFSQPNANDNSRNH